VNYSREEGGCGGVSDWWRHLREHLGINESNYFLYHERPQSAPSLFRALAYQSGRCDDSIMSLNGGLRRVVIKQLRLLGIVASPIPRYDLQNSTLQMHKQTTSGGVSASNGW